MPRHRAKTLLNTSLDRTYLIRCLWFVKVDVDGLSERASTQQFDQDDSMAESLAETINLRAGKNLPMAGSNSGSDSEEAYGSHYESDDDYTDNSLFNSMYSARSSPSSPDATNSIPVLAHHASSASPSSAAPRTNTLSTSCNAPTFRSQSRHLKLHRHLKERRLFHDKIHRDDFPKEELKCGKMCTCRAGRPYRAIVRGVKRTVDPEERGLHT